MEIKVSEEIKKACPQFAGIAIRATVENTAYSESLWKKIDEFTICYREMYTTDSIKDMVTIHATREAYKKCGKDPSRYRPSGEALCRRILRGISLYQIDTLVDLINLVSIRYGYSIGGFDADKIQGLKIQIFQNLIITKSFTKSSYFYYRHLNFSSLFYAHRSLSLQADVPKAYSIPSKSKILQYIPQSNDKISLQRFLPVP